jgi:chromosome segregation ATPase
MIDLTGLLEKSGAVIAVAEAARDGIVERINKDLERQIEKLGAMLADRDREIADLKRVLQNTREELTEVQGEIARLKLHVVEAEKK